MIYKDWLEGKHVLITGGSGGIGSEIARNIMGTCRKLTLVARNKKKLTKAKKELSLKGKAEVETSSLCIGDTDSMIDLINKIYQNDQVDAFINCAGGSYYYGELEGMSHEDIDSIAYANGIAPIHWLRELLPRMKTQQLKRDELKRAHVLLISSRSAERPLANLSVYAAGKCSIEGVAHSLRQEYARYGIVFTLVNPGSINTSFTSQWDEKTIKDHNDTAMTAEESVYPTIQALNAQFAVNRISYESVQQWKTESGVII